MKACALINEQVNYMNGMKLSDKMKEKLPPGQHEIPAILRWNIDHPGIITENPKIDLKKWTLTVDGEVEKPITLNWHDFLQLPFIELKSDFHCVEGWSVRKLRWSGVKFSTLVQIVKPKKAIKHVLFRCSDGYTTSVDLIELLEDNVLLSYKLNGKWLEASLGGPLRLVVPNKYAYKSAMWIERITFTGVMFFGYWEKRKYSNTADVWKNDRFSGR